MLLHIEDVFTNFFWLLLLEVVQGVVGSVFFSPVCKEGEVFPFPYTSLILFRPDVVMIQNFRYSSCQSIQENIFSLYMTVIVC